MENLKLRRTAKTPEVDFDATKGELTISGISIPENTFDFYAPVLKWLEQYAKSPKSKTLLSLKLEYFNTATASFLINFLKRFQELSGTHVVMDWYYEDDDIEMEDVGNDYKSMLNIPVNLIPVESFE